MAMPNIVTKRRNLPPEIEGQNKETIHEISEAPFHIENEYLKKNTVLTRFWYSFYVVQLSALDLASFKTSPLFRYFFLLVEDLFFSYYSFF